MQNHLFCLGDKQIELFKQTRDENKKKQKEKSSLIFIGCSFIFCVRLTSLVQSKHRTWLQTLQRQAYKRSCMIFFPLNFRHISFQTSHSKENGETWTRNTTSVTYWSKPRIVCLLLPAGLTTTTSQCWSTECACRQLWVFCSSFCGSGHCQKFHSYRRKPRAKHTVVKSTTLHLKKNVFKAWSVLELSVPSSLSGLVQQRRWMDAKTMKPYKNGV